MAGPPLRLFMNQFGWRSAMMIVAGLTLGVAALIHGLARDNPSEKGYADRLPVCRVDRHFSIGAVAAGMAEIFHYRNSWLLLVIPGSMTGSVLSFCGLWGVPFLTTHYGMTPAKAAVLASAMMVSMAAGGLCFGWLSDRSGKRKPLFLLGCFGALVPFSVALLIEGLPIPILVAALLIASFCANAVVITFAIAKESVPARLSGTISGMVNMGTMSGPMILQPAIGWMLDFKWHGHMEAGVRIYSFEAYRAGFSLMLAWLLLSLVLLIFIRETHCRQIV
ncbi:MAG: MFS transporter [Desulfatitalea sp.]|nr:MFS transporter [Desulfatitalea sp.]